ncbi:hypothetical protein AN643_03585 [Candidatus Epulonipiscioides saccharophilum]|nr:hypothetical protein AN643_03585 [Epulopiscium sp. SCG-B10WGA-EpuloB]
MSNTYNGYALSKSIQINYSIEENIFTKGNDELLRAIFGNILSNGLRYARTKIDIISKMDPFNSIVSILIKNDGEDITNQDKIFDRFSKGKNGNFGLGLSIAKTSISKLGGDIKAYNDNGAIFEVTIPIAKQ